MCCSLIFILKKLFNKNNCYSIQFPICTIPPSMPFLIFQSGSFAVPIRDHYRSGIICGPIWGSFAVRDHLRSWDHLRTRTGSDKMIEIKHVFSSVRLQRIFKISRIFASNSWKLNFKLFFWSDVSRNQRCIKKYQEIQVVTFGSLAGFQKRLGNAVSNFQHFTCTIETDLFSYWIDIDFNPLVLL